MKLIALALGMSLIGIGAISTPKVSFAAGVRSNRAANANSKRRSQKSVQGNGENARRVQLKVTKSGDASTRLGKTRQGPVVIQANRVDITASKVVDSTGETTAAAKPAAKETPARENAPRPATLGMNSGSKQTPSTKATSKKAASSKAKEPRRFRPETLEKRAISLVEQRQTKLKGKGPWEVTTPILQTIGSSDHPLVGAGVYEVIARRSESTGFRKIRDLFSPNASRRFLVGFDARGNPKMLPISENPNGQPNAWMFRFLRGLNERVPIFSVVRDLLGSGKGLDGLIIGGVSITSLASFSGIFATPAGLAGIVYATSRIKDVLQQRGLERQVAFESTVKTIRSRENPNNVDLDDAYRIYEEHLALTSVRPASMLAFAEQLTTVEL